MAAPPSENPAPGAPARLAAVGRQASVAVIPAPPAGSIGSPAEELANVLSSAAGLVLVLAFSPMFLRKAAANPDPATTAAAAVYVLSLVALYGIATLYHALPPGSARMLARRFDHCAIFVLIAGTYTPFALGPLASAGGHILLVLEWSMAALGCAYKLTRGARNSLPSILMYIAMGWLGLFWAGDFITKASWTGMFWILAGGVAYTGGTIFYAAENRRFHHLAWHLCVLAGSACHAYAIWRFAL